MQLQGWMGLARTGPLCRTRPPTLDAAAAPFDVPQEAAAGPEDAGEPEDAGTDSRPAGLDGAGSQLPMSDGRAAADGQASPDALTQRGEIDRVQLAVGCACQVGGRSRATGLSPLLALLALLALAFRRGRARAPSGRARSR
jgi:MYXO-CTERM domain-containing protein